MFVVIGILVDREVWVICPSCKALGAVFRPLTLMAVRARSQSDGLGPKKRRPCCEDLAKR